ncbi:MAG: hypothetical protein ACRDOU_05080 [Streptosporangiaceae bacterium]
MTVALILADQADAGLRGQLTALGVRRVDAADRAGPALLSVAGAAQVAGERVLICAGDGTVPEEILARLLTAGGTAAFARTGVGALVVDTQDLQALAAAAEAPEAPAAIGALIAELRRRGVRVRVLDAGPDGDGVVARLVVEPVASATAGWLARRQVTPAALYGIALGLGLLSAVWFADPSTRARVVGAIVLLGSLAVGRAGSLLAASEPRSERRLNPAVDWLGAASGLLSEFAVYAALAVASRLISPAARLAGLDGVYGAHLRHTLVASLGGPGTAGVWRLAVAAMVMLGLRRIAWFCYEAAARSPADPYPGSVRRIAEQVISLPAGERYAVIAVTAILAGPRLTFLVLLAWGVVAVGYLLARPKPDPAEGTAAQDGRLAAYRGDGALAYRLGKITRGTLPPLLPVFVALVVTCILAFLGLGNLPGALIVLPLIVTLFPALGARHRHDGRLDWLAPPLVQTSECVFLAALGFSRHVAAPLMFALIAAVLLRHADLAYRARVGLGIPADRFGLGWDGRMLLTGLAAAVGVAPFAYAALTGYLWLLFCWDYLSGWLQATG